MARGSSKEIDTSTAAAAEATAVALEEETEVMVDDADCELLELLEVSDVTDGEMTDVVVEIVTNDGDVVGG